MLRPFDVIALCPLLALWAVKCASRSDEILPQRSKLVQYLLVQPFSSILNIASIAGHAKPSPE